ncbi:MAG: ATP phosphoribosyltransferase [Candidatus Saccharimonadales bacterium]
MRNLENADIAIQKSGRLTEGTLEWLNNNAGTDFPIVSDPFDRTRELTDSSTGITVVGYSNGDTIKAVAAEQTDVGVCGGDMYFERRCDTLELIGYLGFASCKLVLARSEGEADSQIRRIVTSYPQLTQEYFGWSTSNEIDRAYDRSVPKVEVFKGGIEMIGRRNGYDTVVDVVDTGETLLANGYEVKATIREFEAVLFQIEGRDEDREYPKIAISPNFYEEERYRVLYPMLQRAYTQDDLSVGLERGGAH